MDILHRHADDGQDPVHDPDDDLLGFDDLVNDMDLSADEAKAVLGPHSAVTRREAADRWEMLRREQGGRP